MNSPVSGTLSVNIPQLVQLVAKSLYSDDLVCIRELLANAADALERRHLEQPTREERKVELHCRIYWDHQSEELVVEDNGTGLTRDEMGRFLTEVGKSGTAEARARLADRGADLIGRFGIGMLSGFAIGDRITVTSRSGEAQGNQFRCQTNGEYEIEELGNGRGGPSWDAQGTVVRVHVVDTRQERKMTRLTENLKDRILKYALLLRYPVFDRHRGNRYSLVATEVPWRTRWLNATNASAVLSTFLAKHCGLARPLYAFLVQDPKLQYGGILYIPDDARFNNPTLSVDLYSQGLLVEKSLPDVLPPHCVFLHGILEANDLPPTASREEVVRDQAFSDFRTSLRSQVVSKLAELADSPGDLSAVCAQHGFELKRYVLEEHTPAVGGGTAHDVPLVMSLLPQLRFPLARGEDTTLAQYAASMVERPEVDQRRQIYYSTVATAYGYQLDKVLVSRGLDVILIRDNEPGKNDSLNLELLREYAKAHGYETKPVEDLVDVFKEQTGEPWTALRDLFERAARHAVRPPNNRDLAFRVSSFEPPEIPLLLVLPDYESLRHKIVSESKTLNPSDVEVVKRAMSALPCSAVINTKHDVIRALAERLTSHSASNAMLAVAREIIHLAYVYSDFAFKDLAMNVLRDHHIDVIQTILEDIPAFDRAFARVMDKKRGK